MAWGLVLALFLSILAAALSFHYLKRIVPLILHGLLGIALFWALSYLRIIAVPINILTFLIAAFGGVFGVLIVLALAFIGVPL